LLERGWLKSSDRNHSVRNWFITARSSLNRREKYLAGRDGLGPGWQTTVFCLVLIALFTRSPSLITHAQFYAEDGPTWFAQAYNGGWLHSLLLPQAGYLQTMPRLASGLALLFPLQWAPLVMATVGLLIQALPVPILLSARLRNWADLPTRVLLAAVYVVLPNTREIHVVATNTQWHLALAMALTALASAPLTWRGRLFDIVLLLVAALSGPFCIVLAPIVLIFWWLRRQSWILVVFALLSLGAGTQIALLHNAHRVQDPLGATLADLLRMTGGNIVAGTIVGGSSFAWRAPAPLILISVLLGLVICFYCLCFAKAEWKLFLIYCAAVLAASLRSPLTAKDKPVWDMLVIAVSARYWFLPMLAFVWSAIWCARFARARLFKLAGTGILFSMSVGIVHDWRYQGFADQGFAIGVKRMREAKPGDHVIVPTAPEGWHMVLVKKRL
jgi:hypothetical protein